MARSFNRVLDGVLYDLLRAGNLTATWATSTFEILDELWVLPKRKQETPLEYLEFWEAELERQARYEREQREQYELQKARLFEATLTPESTYEDSLQYRRFAAIDLPEI